MGFTSKSWLINQRFPPEFQLFQPPHSPDLNAWEVPLAVPCQGLGLFTVISRSHQYPGPWGFSFWCLSLGINKTMSWIIGFFLPDPASYPEWLEVVGLYCSFPLRKQDWRRLQQRLLWCWCTGGLPTAASPTMM